jgi:DNA invertase Pin-like site-specific DNA recombinase
VVQKQDLGETLMKVAIYARYSTAGQREASIEDQIRECRKLAERHGFQVVAEFSDKAISGGTTQRPGYRSMLAAARARQFDVIVAEDCTRLWRNMAEQAPRLAELADLGIHVVTHDLDTRQESAAMLGAVLGASGEAYRREIGRRTRRGLEGLARSQKSTGGRAYGYIAAADSTSGDREINPEQAAVVVRIFN